MQNKTSGMYWPRAERSDAYSDAGSPRKAASAETAERFRKLVQGLTYAGLISAALFLEVFLRTQHKSHSLEIWTLTRRRAEIENEITRLDMRLTVLESPARLQTLATTEIGLAVVVPKEEKTDPKSSH